MFGGKRERVLEEELMSVKERNARRLEVFQKIAGRKAEVSGQFLKLTSSEDRLSEDMQQMEEQVSRIAELAEDSTKAAGDVYSALIAANNAVGTFDVNHSVFVGQMKKQKDKIMEVVENNKHFTTPMKYISETPVSMKEHYRKMHDKTAEMLDFSKSMEVLALNAAIEAGRMGESGSRFIHSAEEIRNFSEGYEKAAMELQERLEKAEERMGEMEEQIDRLSQLLKENNISMGKLLKDSMQQVGTYEAGQLELRSILSETAVGRADALQQAEQEILRIQEQMKTQIGDIRAELSEQKNSAGELETIYKGLLQSAEKELKD